jgi:hydroxypyruvate isomerase
MSESQNAPNPVGRRHMLAGLVAGAAAVGAWPHIAAAKDEAASEERATKGRIKQSVAFWCFNAAGDQWDAETLCQISQRLGCQSIELIGHEHWPTLKKHGLVCGLVNNGMAGAPFIKGWNNPKYHDELVARGKESIDRAADAGYPNMIAFTGYKWRDAEDPTSGEISREEGHANCVAGFKKILSHAERRGVTLCLEHLNTRDDSHPMKGHPGYQGDDVDWVAGIIREVDSPRLKLLFDIYHVQIMHGDIIRRIEENKDIIGHVHTAGNPGRCEIGDNQEISFPAVMRKLVEIGYTGYVGQEFIPTGDALTGLRQAVVLCDV